MDLVKLMNDVRDGTISPKEAALIIKKDPFEDLGYAKVDHHRVLRQSSAEIVYGAGKTPEQLLGIVRSIKKDTGCVLVTRITEEGAGYLIDNELSTTYHKNARICIIGDMPKPKGEDFIAIVTGGTSDIPVAEEAAITAEVLGNKVERVYDVGVAGLHRLIANLDILMSAKVIVAVAGMEGALASVIGGLVNVPVIAVPTSVGYGASFEGVSALLSMMNSCASGISVVNIDNGFGAGYIASMINHIGE
jgi:pyridinium-3,5-biscarboxylic acid mononucleotide synthase